MLRILKTSLKKLLLLIGFEIFRKPKQPQKFFEIDSEFNNLYMQAQLKTQMVDSDNLSRRERHYTLMQLLKSVLQIKGNIVECGCWRGLSSYQIASYLKLHNNFFNETFYIFDSFEGLSEFDRQKDIPFGGLNNEEARKKEFKCDENVVKSNLKEFNFIEFKKGWIPNRFKEVSEKKFSFVHIDVDLYQPIRDSLEFFYNRMLPGGIIVFDDYGFTFFPGAKKAVDEFMQNKNDFFIALPSGQAFLIKC